MRRLGLPSISAWTLHRSRSLEQVEVPMFRICANAAMRMGLCVAYTLAFALSPALIASADSTEVAGITSSDSTEVAAVILTDDAMPQGPSLADRLAIIREKIQNALEYPALARLHDSDGDALVRFEIDRTGSAQNVRVVRSSGHDRLDTSAVHAVETASPLPWVYGPLEVPVHFRLTAAR